MYGLNEVDTLKACGAVFGTYEMLSKQLTTTTLDHFFPPISSFRSIHFLGSPSVIMDR